MRSETRLELASRLSDTDLIAEVARLAGSAREATTGLVVHLVEFEARRLHLAAGFGSLFEYCVEVLRLSEHEAYNRIEAARVAGRYPVVLEMLGQGALSLTAVRVLAPHLTADNHLELLASASGKTKRQVEELIVRHFPRPDVPASVRKVPVRHGGTASPRPVATIPAVAIPAVTMPAGSVEIAAVGAIGSSAALAANDIGEAAVTSPPPMRRPGMVRPLAADRYEVRFTASAETCEKLKLAKDLLRHAIPDGDTAQIVDRALSVLLESLARQKFAATPQPRPSGGSAPGTRTIPAGVKRAVWLRDGGRCAFLGAGKRRCEERGFLEFHHVRPYGVGGEATAENIEVRCRAHNAYEADLFYGRLVPERVGQTIAPSC